MIQDWEIENKTSTLIFFLAGDRLSELDELKDIYNVKIGRSVMFGSSSEISLSKKAITL